MRHRQPARRFLWVFAICTLLIAIPIKNFGYLVPPLYLFLRIYYDRRGGLHRFAPLFIAVTVISAISLLADSFRTSEINLPGMALALLTYFPLLLLPAEEFDLAMDDRHFGRLTEIVAWFVILQSCVGCVQYLAARDSDAVSGTFGLLDFHHKTITISHVYFTFALFGMILFLALSHKRPIARVAIVMGLVANLLAQSVHQTIFFAGAVGLFAMLQFARARTAILLVAGIACLLLAVSWFSPEVFEGTLDWYDKVVNNPESPKWMAVSEARKILDDPKNLLIGTGLGQYSSRAALITSGQFLSVHLPAFMTGESGYFRRGIEPGLAEFERSGEGSAISKPYFSAMSVLVELGVPLTLLLAAGVVLAMRKHLALSQSRIPEVALIGTTSNAGTLFFVLCCGIENYAEFPSAIFLPLLLYVAARSRASWLEHEGHVMAHADVP